MGKRHPVKVSQIDYLRVLSYNNLGCLNFVYFYDLPGVGAFGIPV